MCRGKEHPSHPCAGQAQLRTSAYGSATKGPWCSGREAGQTGTEFRQSRTKNNTLRITKQMDQQSNPLDLPQPEGGPVLWPMVTRQQAAHLLGLDPRSFDRLVGAGAVPTAVPGRGRVPSQHNAPAVVAAYLAHLERERGTLDLKGQRALLVRAQRAKLEREAAVAEKDLLVAADVLAAQAEAQTALRESVLGIAGVAVQAGLIEPTQEQELDDLCRRALVQAAAMCEGLAQKGSKCKTKK